MPIDDEFNAAERRALQNGQAWMVWGIRLSALALLLACVLGYLLTRGH